MHNDNPEIAAARSAGIPVFERAQAWGEIMKSYKNAICISGTHGKTTTTSMMTHILMEAKMDPTVMIGGYLPLLFGAVFTWSTAKANLMERTREERSNARVFTPSHAAA